MGKDTHIVLNKIIISSNREGLMVSETSKLTGHPTTLEYKRFQDFLKSMGLILNSIQGNSVWPNG